MPTDGDIPYIDRNRLLWETDENSLLGEGSFGRVYRGTYDLSPVAIKVIKPPDTREDKNSEEYRVAATSALKQHRREIHRLCVVNNGYIIRFYGVFRDHGPRDLYIVTEYLRGGSLHDSLLQTRARGALLDDRSFLNIASHMAIGLNHVHSQGFTHGDMKPQNVLLTSKFEFEKKPSGHFHASFPFTAEARIADFGLSKRLESAEPSGLLGSTATTTSDFGNGPCGTLLYMSPEAYEGVSKLSDADAKAADVYAYALILYELITGYQSWTLEKVQSAIQLSFWVREGKRPSWGQLKHTINPQYMRLVERCWSQKPGDRPTLSEVVRVVTDLQRQNAERAADIYFPDISPASPVTTYEDKKAQNESTHKPYPPTQDLLIESTTCDEDDSEDTLSVNRYPPTIVQVPSMRSLTPTEENSDLLKPKERYDFRHGQKLAPKANKPSYLDESPVVEPIPVLRPGQAEIDDSVIGGEQVIRATTVDIPLPAPLDIFKDAIGDNVSGLGLENGNPAEPNGSDNDALNNFANATGFQVLFPHLDEQPVENREEKLVPPIPPPYAVVPDQKENAAYLRPTPSEPSSSSMRTDNESSGDIGNGIEGYSGRKSIDGKRVYNSPLDCPSADNDLIELMNENDTKSFSKGNNFFGPTDAHVYHGSPHEMLQYGSNAVGMHPSQQLPPNLSQQPDVGVFRYAPPARVPGAPSSRPTYQMLPSVPGRPTLTQIPNLSSRELAGTEHLLLFCGELEWNNRFRIEDRDPEVFRKLCRNIGNIARNESKHIDSAVILSSLRVVVSTMTLYHPSFHQNVESVLVFASCNYALCNLFKVFNRITEAKLRTELAEWIAYSISWNVYQDGNSRGPHLDKLSYTATSAARNFMWMNEDNVIAFTSRRPGGGSPVATARLLSSMNYFDREVPSPPVLEASLTALAVIVHFPKQRVQFVMLEGVYALMEVLHRHLRDSKILALIFSMITVLLSGPRQNVEEVRLIGERFISRNGCDTVVYALEQLQQQMPYGLEQMDILEKGCAAMLAAAHFSLLLRAKVAQCGMHVMLQLVKWLESYSRNGGYATNGEAFRIAQVSLGVTLFDLILQLREEPGSLDFIRQMQLPLVNLLELHGRDEHFSRSCRAVLSRL